MLQDLHSYLTPQRQAHIYATGLMTIVALGTISLIALCLAALWLLIELATLIVQSVVECLTTIGTTYASADPLVKFLILVGIGFVVYRLVRKVWRI